MTDPAVTSPSATSPSATSTVTLLTELHRQLPRDGYHRDLICEIRDGLEDAAESYRHAGLTAAEADRRAADEFGDVSVIARQARGEAATRRTVRAAVTVGISYPAILACWSVFYRLFGHATETPHSTLIGNGFTVLGIVTLVVAIVTVGLLRHSSRSSSRADSARRPIAIGFGVLTLLAVLLTYALSAFTHGPPDAPPDEALARLLVQAASSVLTVVMAASAVRALRQPCPS